MSRILLHDSGDAGKIGWAVDAVRNGLACGMVLSPFETPPVDAARRRHAYLCAVDVGAAGGQVYFDPMTHGATATGANKFDIYDEWALWADAIDVRSHAAVDEHVNRSLEAGRRTCAQPIAPTIALSRPVGTEAEIALRMAARACHEDPAAFVAIAGTEEFWSASNELDDFVGEIASLMPAGVSLTSTRPSQRYPWPVPPSEVHGICRTVQALSMRARVLVMNSDFAGLPAISAGAACLGTSWHTSGRVLSLDSFRRRDAGGRAHPRPTFRGLLASLKRKEADAFNDFDAVACGRLHPGPLPEPGDKLGHWHHHLRQLTDVADEIATVDDLAGRSRRLHESYDSAEEGFGTVLQALGEGGLDVDARLWVAPLRGGLERWMEDEGYAWK